MDEGASRPVRGARPRAATQARLARRARILEIVAQEVVDTQEALTARLQAEGFPVTQATVSRDIRDLRLVKVPAPDGRYRYAVPRPPDERMLRLFRDCVVGFDWSGPVVVVHTLPATAQGVAEALDTLGLPEVIGTLAGERTVFVVVKPRSAVPAFLERLRRLLARPEGAAP